MTGAETVNIDNGEVAAAEDTATKSDDVSVNQVKKFKEYPSVLERYYTPRYCVNMNEEAIDHQCVLFHSNKICLLTIALSHPVITEKKTVTKINCTLNDNVDRKKNKVVGKGKKGGQKLQPNIILCTIECSDGSSYKVYSCMKGKLIEMNENLYENPNLLVEKPYTEGYIAVVLSDFLTVENCKKEMLDEAAYEEFIQKKSV